MQTNLAAWARDSELGKEAEEILRRNPVKYAPIDAAIVARQQEEADLFQQLGLIQARVNAAALFDHRYDQVIARVENQP